MDLRTIEIRTSRLLLRPISVNYAQDILQHFTAEIALYMSPKPSKDFAELSGFILPAIENMKNGTELQMVVLDVASEKFAGCAGLHHIDSIDPELGVWIKKESHGQGLGFEAVTALIEWAKTHVDYEYLRYPVDKRNIPSRRIPERHGGIVGREFKTVNQAGFELDQLEYWIYR